MARFVTFSLMCLAVLACEPVETTDTETESETTTGGSTSTADPARWPREFVAGPGTGPALFLHQGSDAPALGYVSEGVPFSIAGLPENGRVPVRIRAGLKVRAWLSTTRLAQRVQRRGKIRDTAGYVGPGDLVRILGPDIDEERMRVEVMPRFGAEALGAAVTGTFPTVGLAPTAPAEPEALSTGETRGLPEGREVPLYDRPRGEVIARLPALTPPIRVEVLRERGEWKGVRVGEGPYLVGYVDADLGDAPPAVEDPGPNEGMPRRLQAEEDKPLWRLAVGTRVRFDGRTVAILDAEGWGREMNRYENTGEVDLFVAVDDDVAVRGMVRISDLQPVAEEAAPAPAEGTEGTEGTDAPEEPEATTADPGAPPAMAGGN